jgi:hypothetical protein
MILVLPLSFVFSFLLSTSTRRYRGSILSGYSGIRLDN